MAKLRCKSSANANKTIFKSFVELENFLARHGISPWLPLNKKQQLDLFGDYDASRHPGIRGYVSYEGDLEFELTQSVPGTKTAPPSPDAQSATLNIIPPPAQEFIEAVHKAQKYIEEGDIYQANISRKFVVQSSKPLSQEDCAQIYHKLLKHNPAPHNIWVDLERYCIMSSSPESFLQIYKLNNKWFINTSPIKGTSALGSNFDLQQSSKDQAEHIMIVDLERNDLSKICKTGSIRVKEILACYKFKHLEHLISTVEGELVENLSLSDIFAACFPSGSITGAPKLRSMEVIKELENGPRGPYTGSAGEWVFGKGASFNILIRTLVYDKIKQELSFHVGAGITSGSIAKLELEETELKARALIESLSC